MKRKRKRKSLPAKSAMAARKAAKRQKHDAMDALIMASAQTLGLALDPAWTPAVKFNFQLILRHAALVDEFPLPDEAEPAAIFHA
jgi:Protein of unknown function (DUF4089)